MASPWLQDHHLQYLKLRSQLTSDQLASLTGQFTADSPHTCPHCQRLKIKEERLLNVPSDMAHHDDEYYSRFHLKPLVDLKIAIEGAQAGCELLIWMADYIATGFSLVELAARADQTCRVDLQGQGSTPIFRILLSSKTTDIDQMRLAGGKDVQLQSWATKGK